MLCSLVLSDSEMPAFSLVSTDICLFLPMGFANCMRHKPVYFNVLVRFSTAIAEFPTLGYLERKEVDLVHGPGGRRSPDQAAAYVKVLALCHQMTQKQKSCQTRAKETTQEVWLRFVTVFTVSHPSQTVRVPSPALSQRH